MKLNTLTVIVAAGLLAAGTAFAQRGAGAGGGQGKGYGGPPQSAEERAARQADCQKNGGVCPQGGPGANCQGKGKGQGNQWRKGARDGTGPRAGTDACPVNPGPAKK